MAVNDHERELIARYIANVIDRDDQPLRATRHLLHWLNERSEMMNLPIPKPLQKAIGNIYAGNFSPAEFERAYWQHRPTLLATLRKASQEGRWPEPLNTNVNRLIEGLGLKDDVAPLVFLIACYTRFEQVQYLCDCLTECSGPMTRIMAAMCKMTPRTVEDLLSPTGELIVSGLIQLDDGDEISGPAGRYAISSRVDASLDRTFDDFAAMRRALLGAPHASQNTLDDYDHIGADRDLIAGVLTGAARDGTPGVNILLYGAPGTGKTELTKVAAATAGVAIYGAGEDVGAEGESDRSTRLSDLVFSLRLLAGSKKAAVLFDEMEDVAWQLIRRGGSKVYLNRLLENNPVPILWTSNNIHEIDPALLRRMTLAVELRLPPASQRVKIVSRLAKRVGLRLKKAEIEQLAHKVEATPAVFENALTAAKLSKGGVAAAERAAFGIVRAVTGAASPRVGFAANFDLSLICANLNLVDLTAQLTKGHLAKNSGRAFSLCLSGPPGTGKSAYARYLARELGYEVVQKRASDLLGAFVGESEKKIAEAFQEAKEAGAFLIFDEADSFLFDRTSAVRSWEITQVNEMLTWMEEHPFPVCFTTNLMERLDAASLRRFTFHVRFDYLDAETLARAFDVFFGMRRLPAEARKLANLTPGDFAQARKQGEVLGIMDQPDRIIALLADISRAKPGAMGAIGFAP